MPNCGGVRLVKKPHEVIAFVDFEDAASAYVAMVLMQGFRIEGLPMQIEYDKDPTPKS